MKYCPFCEWLVLGQGAKVLSGSTQGTYPRHHGSWTCGTARPAGWSERWWGKRWSEWRSRRSEATLTARMNHEVDHGMNEDSNLSQTVCVHLKRENSQGTTTLTDNKEERLRKNEGSSMHDATCIGINYAHRFPKCFRSLHTVLGFSLCTSFNSWHCTKFLTCTRIPCGDSHCENGPLRCSLYTSSRLQQTAVTCKRSNCNEIRRKLWKSHVWGFIQRCFADKCSIPWNLPTNFQLDPITTIQQKCLLLLCVVLFQQSHLFLIYVV